MPRSNAKTLADMESILAVLTTGDNGESLIGNDNGDSALIENDNGDSALIENDDDKGKGESAESIWESMGGNLFAHTLATQVQVKLDKKASSATFTLDIGQRDLNLIGAILERIESRNNAD